jgi:hypothetical protein
MTELTARTRKKSRHILSGALAALALGVCIPAVLPAPAPPAQSATGPATVPGALNPDVTQDTIKSTVCVAGWSATVRPPADYTNALKRKQLASLSDKDPSHYEEDHLVPLSIGGSPRDPANLWPEPWSAARVKDVDELALHKAVCSGRMTLAAAQEEILRKWGPAK